MHSYRSLRLFLCPVAGGHLCFVFARGAFRVIGWGLAGLAAGSMLGGGTRRGRGTGGVGRLDVLLVWKKLFNYVKEVTQRAAYTDGKKRKKRKRERERTNNKWAMGLTWGEEEVMEGWEEWSWRKGDSYPKDKWTERWHVCFFRPEQEEVTPKQELFPWTISTYITFTVRPFFTPRVSVSPAIWKTNRSIERHSRFYSDSPKTIRFSHLVTDCKKLLIVRRLLHGNLSSDKCPPTWI